MSKYSILSLDLNNVTAEQRNVVYSHLEGLKWTKIKPTTTLWMAPWEDNATDESIIDTTKKEVAAAAKAGKVTSYDATTSVGTKPVSWKNTVI